MIQTQHSIITLVMWRHSFMMSFILLVSFATFIDKRLDGFTFVLVLWLQRLVSIIMRFLRCGGRFTRMLRRDHGRSEKHE
jgi:hypothetical protein